MSEYKKKPNVICQNCGEKWHHIKECREPTISLGIILYKYHRNEINYLLVCRRNTIGFVEFIRGRYVSTDMLYIQKLFNVMTDNEINMIQECGFEFLWEHLWMDRLFNKGSDKIKRDFSKAHTKYKKILGDYYIDKIKVNIEFFISKKTESYKSPEWGFPKGRRNHNESNNEAAIREFTEETNIEYDDIILDDTKEFIESYKSYDNTNYKNIYYTAEYKGDGVLTIDTAKREQFTEISDIKFFNMRTVLDKFRPYDIEKKRIITFINRHLLGFKKI